MSRARLANALTRVMDLEGGTGNLWTPLGVRMLGLDLVLFRRNVRELAARGWEIDWEKCELLRRDHVLAIPSSARRRDPTNWVRHPTPLRATKQA